MTPEIPLSKAAGTGMSVCVRMHACVVTLIALLEQTQSLHPSGGRAGPLSHNLISLRRSLDGGSMRPFNPAIAPLTPLYFMPPFPPAGHNLQGLLHTDRWLTFPPLITSQCLSSSSTLRMPSVWSSSTTSRISTWPTFTLAPRASTDECRIEHAGSLHSTSSPLELC